MPPLEPVRLTDPEQLQTLEVPPEWPAVGPAEFRRQAPDAHWTLPDPRAGVRARCSIWWRNVPTLEGHRVGLVGHYGARDADAGRHVLQLACAELEARGCTIAIGPMDGSTWNRYRLVTERSEEPPYFLEPDNPAAWPEHFVGGGFAPLAQYYSALNEDLGRPDPRADEIGDHLARSGVTIRSIDPARFEEELRRIYAVARVSFRNNYLYTPIDEAAFVEQYAPVRAVLQPELVLIAEHGGRPVGFSFSLPNVAEKLRGHPVRTLIIKTIAVLPERERYAGLGGLLVARTHAAGHRVGYTRAIHALMHERNFSRNISGRTARQIRRYTLFACALGT